MSKMVWWPHEPLDGWEFLVLATGYSNVTLVADKLTKANIAHCKGGKSRDSVIFFVPSESVDVARALFDVD